MSKVWRFFSSLWLTIVLAFVICVVAALGSLLTMKYPRFYRGLDQEILFPWLADEGLKYLPLTLWIYALVFLVSLFAINTVVCTLDKVWLILRSKRPVQSFFPHIVHVGFLIALLGHLAGSVGGFRSPGNVVFKGGAVPVPNAPGLTVRLNEMEIKGSAERGVEYLRSNITLLKDGGEVKTGDIEMNGPVIYKGMAFYHLDQGTSPAGIVLSSDGELIEADFDSAFKTSDGASFKLGEIYPDFALDVEGRPYSRSNDFRNPHMEIRGPGYEAAFLDISRTGTSVSAGGRVFRLEDFVIKEYAVLAIHKDPGIWLIIAGSAVLVVGMLLLLFFRGERGELVRQGLIKQ